MNKIAVLYGHGINCDRETKIAFEKAAADLGVVDRVDIQKIHTNEFLKGDRQLEEFSLFALPGGFLHGDDIAAGKILAGELKTKLDEEIRSFVNDGKLVLGICNGFQVLAKYPVLTDRRRFTLTWNDSGRFLDRWVHLKVVPDSHCVFLRDIENIFLPVRHAEGKFVASKEDINSLEDNGQICLKYSLEDGSPAEGKFPWNPNGSLGDVAGVCDPSGRVFGLMPHPEAYINPLQRPGFIRDKVDMELGEGIKIFRNALKYILEEM